MNHSSDFPSPDALTTPFLSLSGVGKTYPGVVALEGLSIDIIPARSSASSARTGQENRR